MKSNLALYRLALRARDGTISIPTQNVSTMTDSELEHLRKMANQIAVNFSFHEDQVARIADHIGRFWAPSMKKLFSDYIDNGGTGVEAPVREAMQEISTA